MFERGNGSFLKSHRFCYNCLNQTKYLNSMAMPKIAFVLGMGKHTGSTPALGTLQK